MWALISTSVFNYLVYMRPFKLHTTYWKLRSFKFFVNPVQQYPIKDRFRLLLIQIFVVVAQYGAFISWTNVIIHPQSGWGLWGALEKISKKSFVLFFYVPNEKSLNWLILIPGPNFRNSINPRESLSLILRISTNFPKKALASSWNLRVKTKKN